MENTNTIATTTVATTTAAVTGTKALAAFNTAVNAVWFALYRNEDGGYVECNPKWVRADRQELAFQLEEAREGLVWAWKNAPHCEAWDDWALGKLDMGAGWLATALRGRGTPAEMRAIIRDMY